MKKLLFVAALALLSEAASAQYYPYRGWGWWADPQGQVGQAGPLNWSYASNRATLNWLYGGGMFAGSNYGANSQPYRGPYRYQQMSAPEQYVQPERIENPYVQPAGPGSASNAPPTPGPRPESNP